MKNLKRTFIILSVLFMIFVSIDTIWAYNMVFDKAMVQEVGSQGRGQCLAYSLAYCRTILDGYVHSGDEYWRNNQAYASMADYQSFNSSDKQTVLKEIYNEINAGRPVCVHIIAGIEYKKNCWANSTAGHWVAAVGYRDGANPDDLKDSDFYVIDPENCDYLYLYDNCISVGENALKVSNSGTGSGGIFKDVYSENVTETNAVIKATLREPRYITSAGIYFGTDPSNMDKIVENTNVNAVALTYDANKWVGKLIPGITYYYELFIVSAGIEYKTDINSFVTRDNESPEIDFAEIIDVSSTGYTVRCKVSDNGKIAKVCFPTWTVENGQDDIVENWPVNAAVYNVDSEGYYVFRVNISDHGNQRGEYVTHIYAYDMAGNQSDGKELRYDFTLPVIEVVDIIDVTSLGYTVRCKVKDNQKVQKVCFPTWTTDDGQDDIAENWPINTAIYNVNSEGYYVFRVKISDHGNQSGEYITHVYVYDLTGNTSDAQEFRCNIPAALSEPEIDMDADTSKYYNVTTNGGSWDGTHYYLPSGQMVRNSFFSEGTYTYYLQADGTPMKDRLTYHPDGVHVIYFDADGHEVFSDFAHISKSIAGADVDDMCFFNVYGYMYVDTLTYDKTGTKLYYVNPYGVLERNGWFQFSGHEFDAGLGFSGKAGGYGYANWDCSLMVDTYTYDWNGKFVYMQGDGHMAQ